MDREQLTERLHELQLSLKDGDDLARAIGLIGDALERRMHSIRANLEDLHEEEGGVADGERLTSIVERVGDTLDRYEDDLEERRRRMEELVEEFQASLGDEARELTDLQADLGGPPPPGEASGD